MAKITIISRFVVNLCRNAGLWSNTTEQTIKHRGLRTVQTY